MQDRYSGDIGDYVKLALLRALSPGQRLGIVWYLHPDQGHNADGKHIRYLSDPDRWRALDPELFDALKTVVSCDRSVRGLQRTRVVTATHFDEPMDFVVAPATQREHLRSNWFQRALSSLSHCDIVFADPDNGLTGDQPDRRRQKRFAKSLPLSEARRLAQGRSAIIYHHNTRLAGGHDRQVQHWRCLLGADTLAVRANPFSCRTFFVLNAGRQTRDRVEGFCHHWRHHRVWLDKGQCSESDAG
jgi:hypothetical protein